MAEQKGLILTESNKTGFFYGYVIVAAAFVIMALSFGINYSFGVFFKPLLAEFGWTRAVTAAAYSLMTLVSGFLGIFAGKLSDSFGARIVGVVCGLLLGLGCFLMSEVSAIWQLYLFYGLIIAAGLGGCYPVMLSTVARWYIVKRGLMTGIVASGIGFGILVFPPVAIRLISSYGWRVSYIIMGIATTILIVLAAQFLKRDPAQVGQLPDGESRSKQASFQQKKAGYSLAGAARTGQFWIACAIYFCFGYFLHNIMVHIMPHAIELGVSEKNAANILAIIGGANIAGRIAIGWVSDRIGIKLSLLSVFVLASAILLWLQLARELWMLYLFAIFLGFSYGGIMALQTLELAELFGLSSLGVILGSVAFVYTIGGAVGPMIGGYLFDIRGNYYLAFWVCAGVAIAGLAMCFFLRPLKSAAGTI